MLQAGTDAERDTPAPAADRVDTRPMWAHIFESWDSTTAPDLLHYYSLDTSDPALWERPWWWLKPVLFSLYLRADSLTAMTFERPQNVV